MNTTRWLRLTALACLLVAGAGTALAVRDPGEKKKKAPPVVKIEAKPDPGTLVAFQNHVGKVFYFEVTGRTQGGTVWGTGVYTSDSQLSMAAVHAGVLLNNQKGVVKVTILAGQGAYQGSLNNGIQTSAYGPWNGSYKVDAVGKNGKK
jgi:hypothetical protein